VDVNIDCAGDEWKAHERVRSHPSKGAMTRMWVAHDLIESTLRGGQIGSFWIESAA
jgi:hypothetical protein